MQVEIFQGASYKVVNINAPEPVIQFINGSEKRSETLSIEEFTIEEKDDHIKVIMPINIDSHILGLGERAFRIDRKRLKLSSLNSDPGGYERGTDPIYFPIPFIIKKDPDRSIGLFINFTGEIKFDTGVENYDRIMIEAFSPSLQIFVFKGIGVKEIVDAFIRLTGRPFMPPKWAIGHTISRYSYYPESEALNIARRYREITRVDAMYMDIHHMDGYRIFKWDRERFRDGSDFLKKMHEMGMKVITIVDPSIKADQNYDVFIRGMGAYVFKSNDDIYFANMWPGNSVFPDFLNSKGRDFWKLEIKQWVKQGIDGIWLDMNEPTILTSDHMFDLDAVHLLDNGKRLKHRDVRNAYPYFEVKATYEALSENMEKPFILTRSGFAGIQKYAAVWTGDTRSSWDDVLLQISMVTSLSISGVTVVGCDLGGFFGDSTPDLIAAYYRMALLFPLYRNHKTIDGNDQEIFLLPNHAKISVLRSIELRYKFLEQIYSALYFSSKEFKPAVYPLAYLYHNPESFYCDDQYILGEGLLYAPQIYEKSMSRQVYIPEGTWYNFWSNKQIRGNTTLETDDEYPLYVKNGTSVIFDGKITLYGDGDFRLYVNEREYHLRVENGELKDTEKPDDFQIIMIR